MAKATKLGRRRGPREAGPCGLLALDQTGGIVLDARRSPEGGVVYDGILYPDELLKDMGGGVYQLASAVRMPADGNMTHNAPYEPLVDVAQLDWIADWSDYDKARRRLNAAALWQKGGDTQALIKNTIYAAILAVSLLTGFSSWRAAGVSGDLNTNVLELRGALIRNGVPVGNVTPGPVASNVPTAVPAGGIGQPTGDRPTPTPKRP